MPESQFPSEIHESFVRRFRTLRNGHVNGLACGTVEIDGRTIRLFELLIGKQRICWEVEDGHGRCFMMSEDGVDGAGVFPLGKHCDGCDG